MHDLGTSWRERGPSETLSLVSPYLKGLGIEGVIEHKGTVGIHVFEAVRRNPVSGYLNLGKGFSCLAAHASAIMEAVEMSLVEMPLISASPAKLSDVDGIVSFQRKSSLFSSCSPSACPNLLPAKNLSSASFCNVLESDIFFPKAYEAGVPLKGLTNGLASGNTEDEAILHSLFELIERDAIHSSCANHVSSWPICPLSLHDEAIDQVYESFVLDGNYLQLRLLCSVTSAVVIEASVYLDAQNGCFCKYQGWGCHVDPLIASRRAISEAIQVWRIEAALREGIIPVSRRRGGLAVACSVYEAVANSKTSSKPLSFWQSRCLSLLPLPIPIELLSNVPLDMTPALLWRRLLDEFKLINADPVFCVRLSPDDFPVHVVRCFSHGLACPPWL